MVKGLGIAGRTVLEVGGGVGAIQIELLKAGAARAVSVELTPTYEVVAGDLAREAGMDGRIVRKVMDFAEVAGQVEAGDVVILNRVVCCYPDMPKLVGAAADRSREVLVLSYPRETWWSRLLVSVGNLVLRVTRREFQVFLHPPRDIIATSERHGLRPVLDQARTFWTVTALRRTVPEAP